MKLAVLFALALALLGSGCQTSTILSRKTERLEAYRQFPASTQEQIDAGQVSLGMDTNAVFIAWGAPSRILYGETTQGNRLTWLYHATTVVLVPYWSYTPNRLGYGTYDHRMGHYAMPYVQREVIFLNGHVVSWEAYAPSAKTSQ